MTNFINEFLKEKRPNISQSSLKTYESIIRNLYKQVFDKDIESKDDLNDFKTKSKEVIDHLKSLEARKRKTRLAPLVVITDNKDYRELMLEDIKEYNKEEAKQTKSDAQKENWVEEKDLTDLYTDLEKQTKMLYTKKTLSNSDLQLIQAYIILSLYNGKYIPPRRSKDYVNFKIKNIDKDKDNYIDKDEMVFNSYKTAKTYGQQRIKIPKNLKTILNKWIKVNPTDYLLFDTSGNQLNNVKLTQRLNKLLGKKASVNQMRKTYLSSKYGDMIEMKKSLNNTMKEMGSSLNQENIYIKE